MSRKPIVAGNWKMNKTVEESVILANSLRSTIGFEEQVETVIAPTFLCLNQVSKLLAGSTIGLAAQDMFWEDGGAYTGEISPTMLRNIHCYYVILGHSERREHLLETNQQVHKKLQAALAHEMTPIVCMGESLAQREAGVTFDHLRQQLDEGLAGVDMTKVVLAYEPIWAIGTGKVATPEQAQEVHAFIRQQLTTSFGKTAADSVRILYGGSVKPANAGILIQQADIDGFLVGGASLEAASFIAIEKEVYSFCKNGV